MANGFTDGYDANQDTEKMRAQLGVRAQIAGFYREMAQTPGFQDLRRELEGRITDLKNKWLAADDVEAARIKIRAQVYNEVFDLIKGKILQGDIAARQLRELEPSAVQGNPWAGESQE